MYGMWNMTVYLIINQTDVAVIIIAAGTVCILPDATDRCVFMLMALPAVYLRSVGPCCLAHCAVFVYSLLH